MMNGEQKCFNKQFRLYPEASQEDKELLEFINSNRLTGKHFKQYMMLVMKLAQTIDSTSALDIALNVSVGQSIMQQTNKFDPVNVQEAQEKTINKDAWEEQFNGL